MSLYKYNVNQYRTYPSDFLVENRIILNHKYAGNILKFLELSKDDYNVALDYVPMDGEWTFWVVAVKEI